MDTLVPVHNGKGKQQLELHLVPIPSLEWDEISPLSPSNYKNKIYLSYNPHANPNN